MAQPLRVSSLILPSSEELSALRMRSFSSCARASCATNAERARPSVASPAMSADFIAMVSLRSVGWSRRRGGRSGSLLLELGPKLLEELLVAELAVVERLAHRALDVAEPL